MPPAMATPFRPRGGRDDRYPRHGAGNHCRHRGPGDVHGGRRRVPRRRGSVALLREHFKVYAFKSCRETPIVPAILGNDAGIYGSVRLIVGE